MLFGLLKHFRVGSKPPASQNSTMQLAHLLPGVYYRLELLPEYRVAFMGEGIFDLLGYKAKELLKKDSISYLQLVYPELEEILSKKKNLCRQSREAKKLQYHLATKSGSAKLVEDHFIGEYDHAGQLIAIHGYFKEIRKSSAKLQLFNQLEAYRAAIDVNIISSITDAKGIIIYANDNFKKISQYSDEELLGKTHRIVCSGHHPKSFFESMWKTISAGTVWRGDILNRAKDGSLYWVDTVIIPVFDEHHQIASYLSLRVLITDRKRAEEQKDKYIRVLEEIAHVVAHDIRGPICSILGLANLIKRTDCMEKEPAIDYVVYAATKLDKLTAELSAKIYAADSEMKRTESVNGWNGKAS
jgi:PAS domain S-box-containing protein